MRGYRGTGNGNFILSNNKREGKNGTKPSIATCLSFLKSFILRTTLTFWELLCQALDMKIASSATSKSGTDLN